MWYNGGMKSFFQKIAKFLKYGAALIAGGFYIWTIIILFNNDNWIGISALTTMLLALAAFWAIWQNRGIQIKNRKDRLLNEIIDWAKQLENRMFAPWEERKLLSEEVKEAFAEREKSVSFYRELEKLRILDDKLIELGRLRTEMNEGRYIKTLGSGLDEELGEAIEAILNNMEGRRELLRNRPQYEPIEDVREIDLKQEKLQLDLIKDQTKSLDGLNLSEEQLSHVLLGRNAGNIKQSALKVIDKATTIKLSLLHL